ncbi:hypothetical protein GXP67_08130 [Rhodocytophaga rosea]|uniref:FkbM family methyltransferase n=1 Tax=Rhodocytophaga rosea TaxID=2704465 RepID=A0A6C0GFM2_9BACT|nr:hypothetical protein [Rhodocytophaga rosea]QHT66624.1 hypothetical protein GXP67_08130 [Rhodocytophaga rosea]
MKEIIKRYIKGLGFLLTEYTNSIIQDKLSSLQKASQISLQQQYKSIADEYIQEKRSYLPSLEEVELRCYSQNGEDGILLYIFSLIGTTNKRVVEISAGDGLECNAANLIINHGWFGLLIDGNSKLIENGKKAYRKLRDTRSCPPILKSAWVTKENINEVIQVEGFTGEIDLFSLDLDGIDYWLLKELDIVSPRVIVLEYQNIWKTERAVTVPYSSDFRHNASKYDTNYMGASLPAFIKLLKGKGYRYVGSQSLGFNAFFIKNGIGDKLLPEVSPDEIFKYAKVIHSIKGRLDKVKDLPWMEV